MSRGSLPEPTRFRVYPKGRSLYFEVKVWPDVDCLRARGEQLYPGDPRNSQTWAFCSTGYRYKIGRDGRRRMRPYCGEVNFFRDRIGAGTVAHEMTHAAFEWSRRVRLKIIDTPPESRWVDDSEERFCRAVDEMVRQFYCAAQRLGFY